MTTDVISYSVKFTVWYISASVRRWKTLTSTGWNRLPP